ncbi:MAG: phosphoribosylamine--glycine ligase [Clostridiales bacterium]|nr:phosphoribosylamine--glycine ligase [Clostridiales bacterium]
MNILVVGGGGREHAIVKKIKENPKVSKIVALPGNGTLTKEVEIVPILATALEEIIAYAKKETFDFAIVSPDNPLCLGLVDLLEEIGIPTFGPNKAAAAIEGSKVFSKGLMKKYHIPTASYEVFTDLRHALEYIDQWTTFPIVIKADGLAYGKGVIICQTKEEAKENIVLMMEKELFGEAGKQIVVEEFLTGPEVSVLCFTDGKVIKPMISSMDYKKAHNDNQGPNTGGMGAIAPNPFYTKELAEVCMEKIFLPTMQAMRSEGSPFKGCLYFGLMLTKDGPKVIEYNCRFGDPETQCILPLLQSDLLTLMIATRNETLAEEKVLFSDQASCCISLCSNGYPGKYETGKPFFLSKDHKEKKIFYFDCGSTYQDNQLVTNSGRVANITAVADNLYDASNNAYEHICGVEFENMYYRNDIGK